MRSINFKNRTPNRYWWFRSSENTYIPPVFSFLTDEEWDIMQEWYDETDEKNSAGESNIPVMSFLQGFIMGNRISNIVQFGHYEGFSTLLIGFMLKRMGLKNSFISVDIDSAVTEYTQKWVDKAILNEYVKLIVSDSISPDLIHNIKNHFNSPIKLIIIDSSHQYHHTMDELELWYPHLQKYGFMVLHNVSGFSTQYDNTFQGGVQRAIQEWSLKSRIKTFLFNGPIPKNFNESLDALTYQDICGLGIIQKNE